MPQSKRGGNSIRRIDFVGNANNYPLIVLHGMRALGIDAHLHLLLEGKLDAPENRFPRYAGRYPEWIHDWRRPEMLSHSTEFRKTLQNALAGSDALVLNREAIQLGATETRPYFCLLTGTDLLEYCNPEICRQYIAYPALADQPEALKHKYLWIRLLLEQRAALRLTTGYSFFPHGIIPRADELLNSLGADSGRQISLLITDTDDLSWSEPPGNTPLHILYGARLTWDQAAQPQKTPIDYKGTDLFLRGFALFIHTGRQAELVMFRKGDHLEQTLALLIELGISANVSWREEASQAEFVEHIRQADVVVDQTGTSHIGMVTVDAMALGRPVIAKAPDHNSWGWDAPITLCAVDAPEEVCRWLIELHDNHELLHELGRKGRLFAEKNFSHLEAARKILNILERKDEKERETLLWKQLPTTECFDGYAELQANHAMLRSKHADLQQKYTELQNECTAQANLLSDLSLDMSNIQRLRQHRRASRFLLRTAMRCIKLLEVATRRKID